MTLSQVVTLLQLRQHTMQILQLLWLLLRVAITLSQVVTPLHTAATSNADPTTSAVIIKGRHHHSSAQSGTSKKCSPPPPLQRWLA